MKNACGMIAVVSFCLATVPGMSQEGGNSVGTSQAMQPAPAAKCQTLQQRMVEWSRLRPAAYGSEAPLVEPASPAVVPHAVLPEPPAAAIAPVALGGEPCLTGPSHRPCWEQLDDWLTYRPLTHSCCDCFPKCEPCCYPPLYAFFLGDCCVHPVEPSRRGGYLRDTSGVCGHRIAALWNGARSNPLWPGTVCVHIRQGMSGFFFHLGESCAPGGHASEESLVEQEK